MDCKFGHFAMLFLFFLFFMFHYKNYVLFQERVPSLIYAEITFGERSGQECPFLVSLFFFFYFFHSRRNVRTDRERFQNPPNLGLFGSDEEKSPQKTKPFSPSNSAQNCGRKLEVAALWIKNNFVWGTSNYFFSFCSVPQILCR